jgi:hypothetical protein
MIDFCTRRLSPVHVVELSPSVVSLRPWLASEKNWAIHEKLARCGQLAREFIGEPTATHLRELEAELRAQLRRVKEQ